MDPADRERLVSDVQGEGESFLSLTAGVDGATWDLPTPAPGWSVRDQVTHVARFDGVAAQALLRPDEFLADRERMLARSDDIAELAIAEDRTMPVDAIVPWVQQEQQRLMDTLRDADWDAMVPWFGPPMSVASCATARIMERWAHGEDVADALGIEREPTNRLRHVAFIGVRTFGVGYLARGLTPPSEPIRVELTLPDGGVVGWGPGDAPNRVSGPVLDFCRVVTRRRRVEDTDLAVSGESATGWMQVAQAFAGQPGEDPPGPSGEEQAVIVQVTGAGDVTLEDADDFGRFHVAADSTDGLAPAMEHSGAGTLDADGEAWINVQWLRDAAGARSSQPEWSDGFAGMLAYAERSGWVRGDTIQAHVETAGGG